MLVVELQAGLEPTNAGAKAANLGKVMAHGLSVPSGFVLTRGAPCSFLNQAGLMATVKELIANSGNPGDAASAEARAALCHRVLTTPIPKALADAVVPMAETLFAEAPCGLAVRSSGVHEDSATASFSGVYQSFLGIRSLADLWTAIRQCWCAAWTQPAMDYAKKMGVTPEPDAMAVLVQQLVAADSAGVLFTADPQTGNPWRFILESTFGLAQELVGAAGNVPADRFVFEWGTGKIIEKQIVEKPTACVPGTSGVDVVPLPDDRRTAPSLQDEVATRIAGHGLDIDRLFGCRVDIEWAVAGDEVFIVQVRPITVLPTFFPHDLPPHTADKTWQLAGPHWYFPFPRIEEKLIPPIYQDLSYAEMYDRYQLGPIELQPYRFVGIEAEFNGYLYLAGEHRWSQESPDQVEAYLREYEPALRKAFLDAKHHQWPALSDRAIALQRDARSMKDNIKASLWARDATFDIYSLGIGPSQGLFGVCIGLLRSFVSKYLPDFDADHLIQGHHPDLDPYYPHVQILEAQELAQSTGQDAIRHAFETMDVQALFLHLVGEHGSSPLMAAYEDYCGRFGMTPPSRYDEITPNEMSVHYATLLVVREAMRGRSSGVMAKHEQATQRRQEHEAKVRTALAEKDPDALPRFDRLLDWVLFWAPALNDRAWSSVPGCRLRGLWTDTCRKLQTAGLIDEPDDIRFFTAEDLAHIAQTCDVEEGRRVWQHRRLEYERHERLHPPAYLGRPPDELSRAQPPAEEAAGTAATSAPPEDRAEAVINGTGLSPGRAQGLAQKIDSLEEVDRAAELNVLVLAKTVQPTSAYSALLLSLILRVQGMVVAQSGNTYTHHMSQIARECGVPIVQISPDDAALIADGDELLLDASEGTVTVRR